MTRRYWTADSDWEDTPDDRFFSCCDGCGEYRLDCEDVTWNGMDTHQCAKCRGDENLEQYAPGQFVRHHPDDKPGCGDDDNDPIAGRQRHE